MSVPRGDERGAGLAVAAEDHRAVLDHQHIVGALHHLSPGEPAEAWDVTLGVLLGGADIYEIAGLLFPFVQHRLNSVHIQVSDAVLFGQPVGILQGSGQAIFRGFRQAQPVATGL